MSPFLAYTAANLFFSRFAAGPGLQAVYTGPLFLTEVTITGWLWSLLGPASLLQPLLAVSLALWFLKSNKNRILPDYYLFVVSFVFILLWPLIPHQSFYNNWLNVLIFTTIGHYHFFTEKIKS